MITYTIREVIPNEPQACSHADLRVWAQVKEGVNLKGSDANTNHSDHQDKGDPGILKGFKFSGYSYAVYESLSDEPQQL